MAIQQHQEEKRNNDLGYCEYSNKFMDKLWEKKRGYPSISQCNYSDGTPEATLRRIGRPSFRKFFGYKNDRVYDAYFSGHLVK